VQIVTRLLEATLLMERKIAGIAIASLLFNVLQRKQKNKKFLYHFSSIIYLRAAF
jgi:hypothetical protein